MTKEYFIVGAKCGHVTREYYILIDFPVEAVNAKQAAKIVRDFKRVKHNRKDAIKYVRKVSKFEYEEQYKKNSLDPYLQCKNIQQQRKIFNIKERLIKENYPKFSQKRCLDYKQKKMKLYIETFNKKISEYLGA